MDSDASFTQLHAAQETDTAATTASSASLAADMTVQVQEIALRTAENTRYLQEFNKLVTSLAKSQTASLKHMEKLLREQNERIAQIQASQAQLTALYQQQRVVNMVPCQLPAGVTLPIRLPTSYSLVPPATGSPLFQALGSNSTHDTSIASAQPSTSPSPTATEPVHNSSKDRHPSTVSANHLNSSAMSSSKEACIAGSFLAETTTPSSARLKALSIDELKQMFENDMKNHKFHSFEDIEALANAYALSSGFRLNQSTSHLDNGTISSGLPSCTCFSTFARTFLFNNLIVEFSILVSCCFSSSCGGFQASSE